MINEKANSDAMLASKQAVVINTDFELQELIDQYVSGMPARIEQLKLAYTGGDLKLLHRCAHQIKGSAGGYGFPAIAHHADRLERLLVDGTTGSEFKAAFADLVAICEQVEAARDNRLRG